MILKKWKKIVVLIIINFFNKVFYNIFKNYGLLLLAILSCQRILQAQDSSDLCSTERILELLAGSGTKWRNNKEWLKDLKKDVFIETNYACVEDADGNSFDRSGKGVLNFKVIKSGGEISRPDIIVRARFTITQKDDDSVIITSSIEETFKIYRINNNLQLQKLESLLEQGIKTVHHKDFQTTSDCKITGSGDKVMCSCSCTTTMPLKVFIKEIEKNRNGFK